MSTTSDPDQRRSPILPGVTVADLTERETQVLRLIAAGHSNEEIAQALEVSPSTVKSHVRSAYRTIGVRTRSQAVLWGLFHGLFPTS